MNLFKNNILSLLLMFISFSVTAQTIKNAVTDTVKVSGNCERCEKTIEKAANKKGVVKADWNVNSKQLIVTFNSKKTSLDEILKRVAYSGYDNEKYLAPDAAYSKLENCCKYKRSSLAELNKYDRHEHEGPKKDTIKKENPIDPLYTLYFEIKDALVKDDHKTASAKAKSLFKAFDAVKMDELGKKEHNAYMKSLEPLKMHAEHISKSDDIEHQREHFSALSKTMYELMQVIKPPYTVYLDHCPMYNKGKGADWISKEKAIKNPYYGPKMLTCGQVKETLK